MGKNKSSNWTKYEAWYLDFDCTDHMFGTKAWFFEFDGKFRETVKLGDNSKMCVMWKGNVKLCIGGRYHVINDIYYLHGLRNNLFSIRQLQ